jgi:hypothetical protein
VGRRVEQPLGVGHGLQPDDEGDADVGGAGGFDRGQVRFGEQVDQQAAQLGGEGEEVRCSPA